MEPVLRAHALSKVYGSGDSAVQALRSVDQAVFAPVGALFPIGDGGMGVFRVEDGQRVQARRP
ncbi:hypothetical protein GCM10028796_05600 [Ramlibacter monticola]|uniref:Uncharacterized protein n=1 Tax=Ramlibacter monticola TaxID=1926872 RepID=A0A936YXG5_9BURK|nr:hypothetical protein [Ramlibacter monticola]MBL0391164.1 hypothetical protein [Ramlibacter monticola]